MVGAAQHRRCGGDGVWVPQAETAIPLPVRLVGALEQYGVAHEQS